MPLTLRSNRQLAPPTPPLHREPPPPAFISLPGSAKRKRLSPSVASVIKRLHDRAIDGRGRATFPKRCVRERFAHLQSRVQIDLFSMQHLPPDQRASLDNLLTFRHRISEICVAEGVVLALTDNGLCAAYCVRTSGQLCVLNADSKEVVRSLFHNKSNGAHHRAPHTAEGPALRTRFSSPLISAHPHTLSQPLPPPPPPPGTVISVSVYHADRYACLRCRSTTLAHLKEGETKSATPLFASESLKWPGFVEFDDVNGKVLTFSAQDCIYKVWPMADPTEVLYAFREDSVPSGIAEIKISPGVDLLLDFPSPPSIPHTHLTRHPFPISLSSGGALFRHVLTPAPRCRHHVDRVQPRR